MFWRLTISQTALHVCSRLSCPFQAGTENKPWALLAFRGWTKAAEAAGPAGVEVWRSCCYVLGSPARGKLLPRMLIMEREQGGVCCARELEHCAWHTCEVWGSTHPCSKQPGNQSQVGWSRGISAPSNSSACGYPVKQYYFLWAQGSHQEFNHLAQS